MTKTAHIEGTILSLNSIYSGLILLKKSRDAQHAFGSKSP